MAKQNYYGSFNPSAAAKALKMADRYFCQITDDGTIYAGSGYVLFKLTPPTMPPSFSPSPAARLATGRLTATAKPKATLTRRVSSPMPSRPHRTPPICSPARWLSTAREAKTLPPPTTTPRPIL